MSSATTAPPPTESTAPADRRDAYVNFWLLMVRTFHLWNQSEPDFDPRMFLFLFRYAAQDELGRWKELPDPTLDKIERTIERLNSPKSLDWIVGKARMLHYDPTLMRAIARTLYNKGSREQTKLKALPAGINKLHAQIAVNLRVRQTVYRLAVESRLKSFVENAYNKWLIDPFTFARLKLRRDWIDESEPVTT